MDYAVHMCLLTKTDKIHILYLKQSIFVYPLCESELHAQLIPSPKPMPSKIQCLIN